MQFTKFSFLNLKSPLHNYFVKSHHMNSPRPPENEKNSVLLFGNMALSLNDNSNIFVTTIAFVLSI